MTRLLLALLAVLTGLAACGSPTLASVQAQSGTTASALAGEHAEPRMAEVARVAAPAFAARRLADVRVIGALPGQSAIASSIHLRADRAHE